MARRDPFRCSSRVCSHGSPISTPFIPAMAPDTAPAVLTIDLPAIVANWRSLQTKHSTGATGAVVKADGYGLGVRPVAAALAAAGCKHFFVATPDEALALRH